MTAYLLAVVALVLYVALQAEADRHRSAERLARLREATKNVRYHVTADVNPFTDAFRRVGQFTSALARLGAVLIPGARQMVAVFAEMYERMPQQLRDDMAAQAEADRLNALRVEDRPMYDAIMWRRTGRHDAPTPIGPFDGAVDDDLPWVVDAEIVGEFDDPDEARRLFGFSDDYPSHWPDPHAHYIDALTEHEGYEGMPRVDGCWADVWSDRLNDYRACGMEPDDDIGLCERHIIELRNAKQETR